MCYDADSWALVRQLGRTDEAGTSPEHFNRPLQIALERDGRVFVADSLNHRVQVIDAASRRPFVRSIGPVPHKPSTLASPAAIAVHNSVLYVGEAGKHQVSVFATATLELLGTFGEVGIRAGQFLGVRSIAVDQEHNEVFVVNDNVHPVTAFAAYARPPDAEE